MTLNHRSSTKLDSRLAKIREGCLWLVLIASLLLLYFASLKLGFASSGNQGLGLLGLFIVLACGFLIHQWWLTSRWDRRFEKLSLDQQMAEIEKWFEE
jgi:hypothetical protein